MFSLLSCKKEITTPDVHSKLIFGKWKLIQISSGYSGSGQPVTNEETVEFLSNGKSRRYVNGKLDYKLNYKLILQDNLFGSKTLTVDYKTMEDYAVFDLSDTSLTLSQTVYDGFSYSYERISN